MSTITLDLEIIKKLEENIVKELTIPATLDIPIDADLGMVVPQFMIFLLDDPKYGSINQTKDQKSIKAIQGVIDLYKEWIDTGIKPDKELWLKAREVAWAAAYAYAAYAAYDAAYAADAAVADAAAAYVAAADAASAYAASAYAADARFPRSEVRQAQFNHLQELINQSSNDGLFTLEDYDKE